MDSQENTITGQTCPVLTKVWYVFLCYWQVCTSFFLLVTAPVLVLVLQTMKLIADNFQAKVSFVQSELGVGSVFLVKFDLRENHKRQATGRFPDFYPLVL
ncbi:hypothetical protein PI95_003980 [Hassallia byssoidea VB512170]|uniref:Uncharacterized protein n=1 Tax=Hassallia byssoidea VB512170 TaxID=1304833 RepID=A0A846H2X9_9CYAN|nr:hypothetical protein [Hassalia byssoidea]NEU71762.1 hypothetical protein [Hassalia byssoidea VB512170]